jgi:hypothetical protein
MPDDPPPPSTEQNRTRPRRLGYAVPGRCSFAQERDGHRHECIAGQGHAGRHRCYCGQWFEQRDPSNSGDAPGPPPPSPSVGPGPMREARLRPEFAELYRWVRPDVWYLAASLEQPAEGDDVAQPRQRRRLSDIHFEFRGGESRPHPGRAPGSERRPRTPGA